MADISVDIAQWSGTAGSNAPLGSVNVGTGLDDNLRALQAAIVLALNAKGSDLASATTVDLSNTNGLFHDVTGTTTITGLGTVRAGVWKVLKFEGALTLTHNATSLILPGAANITTVAGDIGIFVSEGAGNWRCVMFSPVTVTGTGSAVRAASPTFTGTVNGANVTLSGTINAATIDGAVVATQADQEAAASRFVAVSPLRQQFHPSAVKGWANCNFNGTTNGAYNVTSITDVGAGNITVTWATDFSGVTYGVVATPINDHASTNAAISFACQFNNTNMGQGSAQIEVFRMSDFAQTDTSRISVMAVGDF